MYFGTETGSGWTAKISTVFIFPPGLSVTYVVIKDQDTYALYPATHLILIFVSQAGLDMLAVQQVCIT